MASWAGFFPSSAVFVARYSPDGEHLWSRSYGSFCHDFSVGVVVDGQGHIVLTGAFCEQPPLGLIRALENSGCNIVDDDWMLGARYMLEDIPITGDPICELSDAYMSKTVATASKYEEDGNKGAYLIEQVAASGADGVIFAAPSFCDPALLERPMQQEALKKENIPYTSFKYSEDTGQYQVIREQTGTFADAIKLWGDA